MNTQRANLPNGTATTLGRPAATGTAVDVMTIEAPLYREDFYPGGSPSSRYYGALTTTATTAQPSVPVLGTDYSIEGNTQQTWTVIPSLQSNYGSSATNYFYVLEIQTEKTGWFEWTARFTWPGLTTLPAFPNAYSFFQGFVSTGGPGLALLGSAFGNDLLVIKTETGHTGLISPQTLPPFSVTSGAIIGTPNVGTTSCFWNYSVEIDNAYVAGYDGTSTDSVYFWLQMTYVEVPVL